MNYKHLHQIDLIEELLHTRTLSTKGNYLEMFH